MIKNLPPGYIKIEVIKPEPDSYFGMGVYLCLITISLISSLALSSIIALTNNGYKNSNFNLNEWTLFFMILIIVFVAGYLHKMSIKFFFRLFGVNSFMIKRKRTNRSFLGKRGNVTMQLLSTYAYKHALDFNSYVFIVFSSAFFSPFLFLLAYIFRSSMGIVISLIFLFAFYNCFVVIDIVLFARLLKYPSSSYFVDRFDGLYVYDKVKLKTQRPTAVPSDLQSGHGV